jgi:hypothetical protein
VDEFVGAMLGAKVGAGFAGLVIGQMTINPVIIGAILGPTVATSALLGVIYYFVAPSVKIKLERFGQDRFRSFIHGFEKDVSAGKAAAVAELLCSKVESIEGFPPEIRIPLLHRVLEHLDPSQLNHVDAIVSACRFTEALMPCAQGYRILEFGATLLEEERIAPEFKEKVIDALLLADSSNWPKHERSAGFERFLEKLLRVAIDQRDLGSLAGIKILDFIISRAPKSMVADNARQIVRAMPIEGIVGKV